MKYSKKGDNEMSRKEYQEEIMQTFKKILPTLNSTGLEIVLSYCRGIEDAMMFSKVIVQEE